MKSPWQEIGATLGRIGYQAMSAGISRALEELGQFTGEVDARVKRGARQAAKMANGEPFSPEEKSDGSSHRRR